MNANELLPQDLTPLNLKAYLMNAFGVCGCSQLDVVCNSLTDILSWCGQAIDKRTPFDQLYHGDLGVYYLTMGQLENLDLVEHGVSVRFPHLTENGGRLLFALESHSDEEIDAAVGKSYDGEMWP